MKTVYYYWTEYLEMDYSDDFLAQIEFESRDNGLCCDISLIGKDGKVKHRIGGISSPDYEMERMHKFAMNLLSDKDYVLSIWKEHQREK